MSRKKRTRGRHADEYADDFDDEPQPRPPRRVKRWKRRVLVLLLLMLAAIAAAPTIVGRTILRNTLLVRAMPPGWHISSEQAELGWLGYQSIEGLVISDEGGKTLLTIESVTVPKSLLSLAASRDDLGKIELIRPTAYVDTRPDGSNWEDFVAALQSMQQQPSSESTTLSVDVVEGVVRGTDAPTGRQWLIENANVSATIGEAIEASGDLELLSDQSEHRGKLKFRVQPNESNGQQVELLAERLPLRAFDTWLARFAPGTALAGVLSADASARWHNDPQQGLVLQTSGRMEAAQLEVATVELSGDRLIAQNLTAPWEISLTGDQVTIRQLQVDADWAHVDAAGQLSIAELQELRLARLLQGELPRRQMQLRGDVDLAALASMLPNTLQLRQGVRLDAGKLTFNASGQPTEERFVWQAEATVANVAGTDGRRQIRWQEPIETQINLRETNAGARLETMTINAPFAQANVQTEQDAVTGDFEVDLAKLSQELSQFVDLQSWQLQGLGEGKFSLTRQANQQFTANASLALTDLRVADVQRDVWTEPKLEVTLDASGGEFDFTPVALATAKVKLTGPRDQFEVTLLEPVSLANAAPAFQLQVEGNGPLELWAARLRPWLSNLPDTVAGDAHMLARLQLSDGLVRVIESAGSVVQLRVENDSIAIDEPRVEFSGSGTIDSQSGILQAQEMQLLGSSFSFRARDVDVAVATGRAPLARGNVAFRADLERLATMSKLVGGTQSTWPKGTAVGQLQLATNADEIQADFGMKVEKLQLLRTTAASGAVYGRPEVVWEEPLLETSGVAKYVLASDIVQMDNLRVQGKTLQLSSSAIVERVSSDGMLSANGLVEYVPAELAQLVAAYAGNEVQLQGDRQVRFQVAGPLFAAANSQASHWSHTWDATAEAGWTSAGAYGMPLGGGKLKGSLREGRLQFEPLDVAVGQGRFTAEPLIRLVPAAEQLVLRPGPLVTNVEISPEVSEKMLKYVAPILAGATRTEGEFSVDLTQAEVPFGKPNQVRVQGQLMTHRLSVSPGPMMNQLIALVKQVESLSERKQFLQAAVQPRNKSFLTMVEQQVDFQVAEGRVYHRNLEFLIDDAPVRSYGSVGFDQTLSLMIEVPIQDKWIEREPALRGFAGQSLRLPIYGTFQKPRIDERAVADLTKQLLQGAATQAIGDELNRQFEKLFRGN